MSALLSSASYWTGRLLADGRCILVCAGGVLMWLAALGAFSCEVEAGYTITVEDDDGGVLDEEPRCWRIELPGWWS